jgi:hypothetical protein
MATGDQFFHQDAAGIKRGTEPDNCLGDALASR